VNEALGGLPETNGYRATLDRAALTRSSALKAYAAVGAREDGPRT
jgi:hypothetical protein